MATTFFNIFNGNKYYLLSLEQSKITNIMATTFFNIFNVTKLYLLQFEQLFSTNFLKSKVIFYGLLLCNVNANSQNKNDYQKGFVVTANGVHAPAQEKRYALVIGNQAYQYVVTLQNTLNDADKMKATLSSLNFEVECLKNASRQSMMNAIQNFCRKAQGKNSIAVIYYSGHGIQISGNNYFIPIDAQAESPSAAEMACVPLRYMSQQLEEANIGTKIIILDACRNNPFSSVEKTRGVFTYEPASNGTFIAFATATLKTATESSKNNISPYTMALLEILPTPNISIESVFKRVRIKVKEYGQTSWDHSSLEGNFYFNPKPNQSGDQKMYDEETELIRKEEEAMEQRIIVARKKAEKEAADIKQKEEDEAWLNEARKHRERADLVLNTPEREATMGRTNKAEQQIRAKQKAQQIEFERINADYGTQSPKSFNINRNRSGKLSRVVNLFGSKIKYEPNYEDIPQKTGRVVLDICIGDNGNVLNPHFNANLSNTNDGELIQLAMKNVKQYKFTAVANQTVCGTIIYQFNLQ